MEKLQQTPNLEARCKENPWLSEIIQLAMWWTGDGTLNTAKMTSDFIRDFSPVPKVSDLIAAKAQKMNVVEDVKEGQQLHSRGVQKDVITLEDLKPILSQVAEGKVINDFPFWLEKAEIPDGCAELKGQRTDKEAAEYSEANNVLLSKRLFGFSEGVSSDRIQCIDNVKFALDKAFPNFEIIVFDTDDCNTIIKARPSGSVVKYNQHIVDHDDDHCNILPLGTTIASEGTEFLTKLRTRYFPTETTRTVSRGDSEIPYGKTYKGSD